MPRIVPIQLLKCLKVLLDDNGGILSAGEVKRLASLMTKYSKKLVSKCIYVQILKCTKTELLGEFMGAGGWSLVYTWLNDAIRAMNWPLVQEILELLLLCPVDVHRLKINSAPKLVKGLCKDGGNEGVRILAKRLVEQWLKVVTENPEATLPTSNMIPQATAIKTSTVAVVAPQAISVNVQQQQQQTAMVDTTNKNTSNSQQQKQSEQKTSTKQQKLKPNKKTNKVQDFEEEEEEVEEEEEDEEEGEDNSKEIEQADKDPLGGVDSEPISTNYTLTAAQKKASESGLVYKFIIKDGQSILAKVPPKSPQVPAQSSVEEEEEEETESNALAEEDADEAGAAEDTVEKAAAIAEADENSSSLDKTEKDNDSNSGSEDKTKLEDTKKLEDKKLSEDKDKSVNEKDRKSSKEKERRGSSSSIEKEKEKDKDKEVKSSKSSSSSSSHRSSSHKSSSSSSKSSSSSSSKSKSSSSSSSFTHRSSGDKHRSDKERSSSSKDKDKDRSSSSSSSSKHRSSSSKSSSSSSSSSKDKYRDKEKSSSSSSSSKSKDKLEQSQSDKDKAPLEKITSSSSSLDKLGKIPKKSKEESGAAVDSESSAKSTSITIPSKKASMSIEIRKDTEKTKTVKTYKSQFRSHGLTEEAPPPPSRKGLKKPSSTTPTGTVLPSSLPSSLKRTSPPPRDLPSEKKAKIDINNVTVANEKPGAIKLIPPKKIQTLVETNLFSDALSAARGPKKINKRKRPNTPLISGKEGPASPTSLDAPKVTPLKFYQDTLDESKTEDSKPDKANDEAAATKPSEENATADDKDIEDDDDIPLKKVKEDIEQKVAQEKKLDSGDAAASIVDITKDDEEEKQEAESGSSPSRQQQGSPRVEENEVEMVEEKKPGPGCGPNGPPGVLMLHRRKGPKKKLSWRPQETLEQVRYFELDENERCNVTKTSFMDMKNLEHFNERDAIVMARRGFNHEDNMEPQTHWRPLMEVDEVPPHPEGNQSKQRKIQADRELATLRALYFTHALIPDSPAEAEFEPAFNHDVPLIPLDDLTGNPDAVNDFTSMPWPEPRGSPKQGDNTMSGTGGLGSPVDMFGGNSAPMPNVAPSNNKQGGSNPFNPFVNSFGGNLGPNVPNGPPMQTSPQNQWQGPGNNIAGNGPMIGNPYNGSHGSPIMDMGGPGPMGPMMNNGPPQNFMNQFSPNFAGPPNNPFMGGPSGFNNGPNNFGPMGPNGPMMNGMGPGPMGNNCPPQMMNGGHNNRHINNRGNNGGGNWRTGGSNFQDNNGGSGNWRPAGPGPNNRNGGGGNNNNGICKAFMRGHCRLGNSCKYIHPNKSKRI